MPLEHLSPNLIKRPSPNHEHDSDDRVGEDHRSPHQSDHLDRVPHCKSGPPQLADSEDTTREPERASRGGESYRGIGAILLRRKAVLR
jgi:hypothetical protein